MNLHIEPEWPAPANVRAFFTRREPGFSQGRYRSLNLGDHVGDDAGLVNDNRASLLVPQEPFWMEQVHSSRCLDADDDSSGNHGDASFTRRRGIVLAVMVADCLPILLASDAGDAVAVIHAGWRGLANGVIENTLASLPGKAWHAWLGPAIGPCHYEVGEDVFSAFGDTSGFEPAGEKWMMDLYSIAGNQLKNPRILSISGGEYCTYCQEDYFFSYRRDGITGRMAGLIWMEPAG